MGIGSWLKKHSKVLLGGLETALEIGASFIPGGSVGLKGLKGVGKKVAKFTKFGLKLPK